MAKENYRFALCVDGKAFKEGMKRLFSSAQSKATSLMKRLAIPANAN